MTETFHQFFQLPWELREEIWLLATRRKRPGAHTFSIYNVEEDRSADRSLDMCFDEEHWCWDVTQRLSAPKSSTGTGEAGDSGNAGQEVTASTSWTSNNESTYIIDGGLWTACKESRYIMHKIFPDKNRLAGDAASTSCFMGEDSVRHYFTISPHQDLFILQPFCFNTFSLDNVNCSIPLGSSLSRFNGLQNIALEYDPSWGRAERESVSGPYSPSPVIECILQAIREGMCVRNIWIIDYGIKRTQNVLNKDEEQWRNKEEEKLRCDVFYQEHRRFVECIRFDLGPKWDDSDAYSHPGTTSGREFVDELEDEITTLLEGTYEEDWGCSYDRPFVSLMACEYY